VLSDTLLAHQSGVVRHEINLMNFPTAVRLQDAVLMIRNCAKLAANVNAKKESL
jgi:hypothetical protein